MKKHFVPPRGLDPTIMSLTDSAYTQKVKQAGLYGKAFFGHKRSRSENWILEKFWNESMKEATDWTDKRDKKQAKLSKMMGKE